MWLKHIMHLCYSINLRSCGYKPTAWSFIRIKSREFTGKWIICLDEMVRRITHLYTWHKNELGIVEDVKLFFQPPTLGPRLVWVFNNKKWNQFVDDGVHVPFCRSTSKKLKRKEKKSNNFARNSQLINLKEQQSIRSRHFMFITVNYKFSLNWNDFLLFLLV